MPADCQEVNLRILDFELEGLEEFIYDILCSKQSFQKFSCLLISDVGDSLPKIRRPLWFLIRNDVDKHQH